MSNLVDVQCAECGEIDQAFWGEFGAESDCPVCRASSVELFRIN
jgi:hypothetical protein